MTPSFRHHKFVGNITAVVTIQVGKLWSLMQLIMKPPTRLMRILDQFDSALIPVDTEPDFEFFGNHGTSANMVVLDWVIEHQIWVDCFNKHGLKLTVMDGVLQNLKARFKCWKTVIANLCAEADLKSQMQVFATCLGHMRFAHVADNAENEHCITCGSPKPEIAPSNSVHYLPLLPRIHGRASLQQLFPVSSNIPKRAWDIP